MAFCSFEHWTEGDPAMPPVLLIHGYGCNSGYWHSMSRALRWFIMAGAVFIALMLLVVGARYLS